MSKEKINRIKNMIDDMEFYRHLYHEDAQAFRWLIQQAEHRDVLQERLQKRGIERKRMINTIKRQRRKIEKLEWDLMVSKGVFKDTYDLARELKERNKNHREALEFYAKPKNWLPQNEDVLSLITMDYGEKARKELRDK